ncbi:MAG: tetratricopeptide repeat protein [Candidatus Thioglobus sp.]|uniref:tetratricopeptide repeat protein n=1 Tax=Candidatus Thioglobus sp. TaxID=2026721 RepID=UPI00262F7FC7|nr:tetratricopeptide repeat protein [Candidatus Thioglobus sp.]MDC9727395.1 tetratricopeptide repeat protein [Candidatus Thioglobus sp.]
MRFTDLFKQSDYRIITALLIFLPLLIYWQVYDFEFVWDDNGDPIGHLKNPFVTSPSWTNFWQLFTQSYFGMYIPISYLFWGVLKSFAELLSLPLNSVLHLTNVVVHIVNGLLVFTVLRQFVINKWAVLVGVLFFLLHPIQVEVVAWVSEFRTLLAFCFSLSALYLYLKNQTKFGFLPLVLFILALLSKPSAITLVAFVLVINHFHYKFRLGENFSKTLPFALIALFVIVVTHSIQSKYGENFSQYLIEIWQRPFAWLDSIVFYLYKLIYPYHLGTSYTLSPKFISSQWWFYPLALLPLGLGYLLWIKRKQQPLLVFAGVLFVVGFFVTSGWVSFAFQRYSLVADRYLYFAMIGVALFVATLIANTDKKHWQGLILSVLVFFTTLSVFRQIPIWQNGMTLWSHSVDYEITPSYAILNLAVNHQNYGESLVKQEKYQQAMKYFNKAIIFYSRIIKQHPDNHVKAYSNRAVIFYNLKQYQKAIKDTGKIIEYNIKDVQAHNIKIQALIALKQCKQAKAALKQAQKYKIKVQIAIVNQLKSQCP